MGGMRLIFFGFLLLLPSALLASEAVAPAPRDGTTPRTGWEFHAKSDLWSRAALSALKTHGAALTEMVPADVETWCPAYAGNDAAQRRAFWVGLLSALAKHESTWRPDAVGGGGKWYGLLQILPATARGYGCRARSGAALKVGAENLSCAIRIMAVTVPRDGVIAQHSRRWRGVAADWGPMTNRKKRAEMAAFTKAQPYCRLLSQVRPEPRPDRSLPDVRLSTKDDRL